MHLTLFVCKDIICFGICVYTYTNIEARVNNLYCTFFGHRHTSAEIAPKLKTTIIDLIENKSVALFLVGNQGNFDLLVKKTLSELKKVYSYINYYIVLAYMPTKKDAEYPELFRNTIFPDGLESVPPKYAISRRNMWMIDKSDYVITYVEHNIGGAAQFKEYAEKKGKKVINIA